MELSRFPVWLLTAMVIFNILITASIIPLSLTYKENHEAKASINSFSLNEIYHKNLRGSKNNMKEKLILKINYNSSYFNEKEFKISKNKENVEDSREKKLRKLLMEDNLAVQIIFFTNFIPFYFEILLITTYFENEDGQLKCNKCKANIDLTKDSPSDICISICCMYIVFGTLYGINKCFGRYGARYFYIFIITLFDFIFFITTMISLDKSIGNAIALYIVTIVAVIVNTLVMIVINTCLKFGGDDTYKAEASVSVNFTAPKVTVSSPVVNPPPVYNSPSVHVEAYAPLNAPPHYIPPHHPHPPQYAPPHYSPVGGNGHAPQYSGAQKPHGNYI